MDIQDNHQNTISEGSLNEVYRVFGQEQWVGKGLVVCRGGVVTPKSKDRERLQCLDQIDDDML